MTDSPAATISAVCAVLGVDLSSTDIARVSLELRPGEYPRVLVERVLRDGRQLGARTVGRFRLVLEDEAGRVALAEALPAGSVRAAVTRYGDEWRDMIPRRFDGYARDGETVSRAQCRDMAVMQRASETRDRGTIWDERVWSGVPIAARVLEAHGV